jgi:hypothetical protein
MKEVDPRIPWKLVADLLGSAKHTSETTGLECPGSTREGTVKVFFFSSNNSDSVNWKTS